jgi:hypothetical protein
MILTAIILKNDEIVEYAQLRYIFNKCLINPTCKLFLMPNLERSHAIYDVIGPLKSNSDLNNLVDI